MWYTPDHTAENTGGEEGGEKQRQGGVDDTGCKGIKVAWVSWRYVGAKARRQGTEAQRHKGAKSRKRQGKRVAWLDACFWA